MSILSTIIKDVESFASKFEKELAKLWSKAPSIAAVAGTVLQFVAPLIETAFTIEAGAAAGTAVTSLLEYHRAKDSSQLKGLITAVGATPTLTSLLPVSNPT